MNKRYSSPRKGGSRSFSSNRKRNNNRNSRSKSTYNGGRRGFCAQKIDPRKFINKNPVNQSIEDHKALRHFSDFGLSSDIVRNLTKKGYSVPTHIQDESIPHILEGKDLIGLANTGSGKTAAFVLPIIEKLKTKDNQVSVLVIAPTRELAVQIQDEFKIFAEGMRMYSVLVVGGLPIRRQISELGRGPHVVIGTPGRLKDVINRGALKLGNIKTLVLDEADRMLDMGFLPDITYIISKTPAHRQTLCFSATTSSKVSNLMHTILRNPVTVSVRTSETGEHVAQDVIRARTKEEKMIELKRMLSQDIFEKVLIFGQMKHGVQKLSDELNKMGFSSMAIHGNKTQSQRQKALDAFKEGRINILVATDVAARGLDIKDVTHVINYDQPNTHEEYVHRIGRTGRAGKSGQAYTFV